MKNCSEATLIEYFYSKLSERETILVREEVGRRFYDHISKRIKYYIVNPQKYEKYAQTVKDLKQEIFKKFIIALERGYLRDNKKVINYLNTIIFHSVADFCEAKLRMEVYSEEKAAFNDVMKVADAEIDKIHFEFKLNQLNEYIERELTKKEIIVYKLFLAGKRNGEIAAETGIEQGNVATIKTRIKLKIKRFIENY